MDILPPERFPSDESCDERRERLRKWASEPEQTPTVVWGLGVALDFLRPDQMSVPFTERDAFN